MANDFIDKVNKKFPSLSQTETLLNNVISEIFNYWSQIDSEIRNSNDKVSSNIKYDSSSNPWTQFHLEQNYLRAAREGEQIIIKFASYQSTEDDQVIGKIFIENSIPIFDKTNTTFEVSMLESSLELLLK